MFKDALQTVKTLSPLGLIVVAGLLFAADNQAQPTQNAVKQTVSASKAADRDLRAADLNRVTLNVGGMSCSGCIANINSSLAGLPGIDDVWVDLQGGRVEVTFDRGQIDNVERIAAAISAGGYPAEIASVADAADIQKETRRAARLSETHVAAVGDWEIARSDYEMELGHARNRYASLYGADIFGTARGRILLDRLKIQIVNNLIVEGIQLREISRAGFSVTPGRVNEAFKSFLEKRRLSYGEFTAHLEKSGYTYAYFMKKFENRVLIEAYLSERVFGEITNEAEKQSRYNDWFNNARLLAEVTYYDETIERLVRSESRSGGCGGGCTARQ